MSRQTKWVESLHWIDDLEIHLDEVPDLLVTGNGKRLPRIAQCTVIIVPLSRRPALIKRGPGVPGQARSGSRVRERRAPRSRRRRCSLQNRGLTCGRILHHRLRNWHIASNESSTSLDAPPFSRAIKSTRDIKVNAILAAA